MRIKRAIVAMTPHARNAGFLKNGVSELLSNGFCISDIAYPGY